jgi:hypothetical protein
MQTKPADAEKAPSELGKYMIVLAGAQPFPSSTTNIVLARGKPGLEHQ